MAWKKWGGMGKDRPGKSKAQMPMPDMTGGEKVRKMMRDGMMDAKAVMPMNPADCFLTRQRMNGHNHSMMEKKK